MASRRFHGFARVAVIPIVFAAVVCPLTIFGQQAGQPQEKKELPPAVTEEPTLVAPTLGGAGKPLPGIQASTKPAESTVTTAPQSTSVDDALRSSNNAAGVETQRRSAVAFDPRVRGYHVGQLTTIADGAFWTPARIDLDTALGKINPDWVQNIDVIKGPYSVRYGPGFAFLDVQSVAPQRYKDGFEAHGSTSLGYKTNGAGWTARQYIWGGNCDWGFRLGYNILAGNDYYMGNGERLPTSYNAQNVDFAIGFDLSKRSSLEVKYLHVQQYDTEYPGLLTDINRLATDGVSVRYVLKESPWFDKLTADAWYNITSFEGDSAAPGKRFQIPQLDAILRDKKPREPGDPNFAYFNAGNTQVRLDLETQADLYTWGFREAMTWGEDKCVQLTLGADINVVRQQYDEFDSFNFSVPSNFGIPKSRMIDPGIFVDGALPVGERVLVRLGTRVDFASTELIYLGPAMQPDEYLASPTLAAEALNTQRFFLWSAFATAEYKASDLVSYTAAYGYAQRPPTLTELYTDGAFFGLIQNGLNAIFGDPTLDQEQVHQIDLGLTLGNKDSRFRGGAHGFGAWVQDYITYQNLVVDGSNFFLIKDVPLDSPTPGTPRGQVPTVNLQTQLRQYRFFNTGRAQFLGFETYGEYDVLPWLAPFATVSYVNGTDLSRNQPLPGIAPLESRIGLRFHDPNKDRPRWGLEVLSRLVARQGRSAELLGEVDTAGFSVFDVRGFWQPREKLLFTAGVENIGDRFYQEHLDLRTGRGVYQPGINFYAGMRVNY